MSGIVSGRAVSRWPRGSVYTDWLGVQLRLLEAEGPSPRDSTDAAAAESIGAPTDAAPAPDSLAAALLLRADRVVE